MFLIPPPDAGAASSLVVTLDFAPTSSGARFTADAVVSVLAPSGADQTVSVLLSGIATAPDESHCLVLPPSGNLDGVIWSRVYLSAGQTIVVTYPISCK